jgi:carboxyl-terminal processing protease
VEPTLGFGIELCWTVISFSDGYGFLIDHVYPSSPAAIAGLQRGDVIKRVNGQSITANNYETLFYSIQTPSAKSISIGREGLSVEGKNEIVNFELAASYYHQTPVAFCDMLQENVENGFVFGDKKIGYISYMSFDSDYDDELISGLAKLEQAGATDVIIDLRNNGAGSVEAVCSIADELLPEGPIVFTEYKGEDWEERSSDAACVDVPMAVLMNENSASASEILAGAFMTTGVIALAIFLMDTVLDMEKRICLYFLKKRRS